jgi:hypothetical protein
MGSNFSIDQCNIEEKPGYPCTMRKKSQENWCIYRKSCSPNVNEGQRQLLGYPDTKCKERRCDSPRVVGENGVPHGFCEERRSWILERLLVVRVLIV